jgi:hypothetical protein
MTLSASNGRHALTLLEVIVAMAIFLMSIIAIFQLLFLGTERAMDVRLQTRTSLRCQAKLSEIMIGAEPLNSSGSYTNFTDTDTDLQWKMTATPNDDMQMLWTVKVWVKAELQTGKVVESHLCQLALNPAMRGTTFDQPQMTSSGSQGTDSSMQGQANSPAGGAAPASATTPTGGGGPASTAMPKTTPKGG